MACSGSGTPTNTWSYFDLRIRDQLLQSVVVFLSIPLANSKPRPTHTQAGRPILLSHYVNYAEVTNA